MNTKALNSLADLILRAQGQDRTPMGIALAVDAAGRHMSPETAAELERLRAEVAELRAERHDTNEALSDAAEQLRANRDRLAELEALKPATIQTCRVCGAGYTYGKPCSTCEFRKRMAAEVAPLKGRSRLDASAAAAAQATHWRRLGVEDPHDSPLAHTYRVSRDLPPIGGATC